MAGFVLVVAGVACGLATFAILTGMTPIKPTSESTHAARCVLNGIVLLVMALLVLGQILFLLIEKRRGTPGASLHLRLVSLFSLIAVVPAIIVAVFATVTLNRGLDAWFSQRTRAIVDSAVNVAESYVRDHAEAVRNDVVADLDRPVPAARALRHGPDELPPPRGRHAALHGLPAVFIFDPTKQENGKQEFEARVVASEQDRLLPAQRVLARAGRQGRARGASSRARAAMSSVH